MKTEITKKNQGSWESLSETYYDGYIDDVVSKGDGGDFITPGNQQFLQENAKNNPLWAADYSSRCPIPFWERPELLRSIKYEDLRRLDFSTPQVEFPALVPTPTGDISLKQVAKTSPVMMADHELYHYNCQKVFAFLTQFNVCTEQQIQAYTGLSLEEVQKACAVLYHAGIILSPRNGWIHQEKLGNIWWMKINNPEVKSYYDNMDSLARALTLGGREDISPPPGSGGPTALRHNLFLTEMCLRLCEQGDNIAGVWGDYFGAEHLFHTPSDGMKTRRSHGDAIIVTNNGSLVILELSTSRMSTINSLEDIVHKAASWVGVIANSHLDISVIFIDTRWRNNRRMLYRGIFGGVAEVSRQYCPDEYSRQKALNHIGLTNAAWWFPGDNAVSQAATRLMSFSMMDKKFYAYDRPDVEFSDAQTRKNVVINTSAALHTPSWIQDDISPRDYGPIGEFRMRKKKES